MITNEELEELERYAELNIAAAQQLGDAIKATAKKHDLDPGGLRQYVTAKVRDKLEALDRRNDTIAQMQLFEHNAPRGE